MATISIMGLYRADDTLFSGVEDITLDVESLYPELSEEERSNLGVFKITKQEIIQNILAECAELEVIYPDPAVMKDMITLWARSERLSWARLFRTTILSYDPIANYDRSETWTNTETRDLTRNNSVEENERLQFAAGYNSATLQPTGKETASGSTTDTDSGTVTYEHSAHISGNIGVTTTQQMIAAEREILQFNILDYIANRFKQRFCLLVY